MASFAEQPEIINVDAKPKSVNLDFIVYKSMLETIQDIEDVKIAEKRRGDEAIPIDDFFKKLENEL